MQGGYPTFQNDAGIGNGMGYFSSPLNQYPPVTSMPPRNTFIPMQPHQQMVFRPTQSSPDPISGSHTIYNPRGVGAFNPWTGERTGRDGR